MKPGVTDHPKFHELKQLLDLTTFQAAGVLEVLWYLTAKWQEDGGIGRWTDSRIAAAMEWRGDASALIEALVTAGWLDRTDDDRRLVVHDWEDHRPNYVDDKIRKREERERRKRETRSGASEPAPEKPADSPAATKERRRTVRGRSKGPSAGRSSDSPVTGVPNPSHPIPLNSPLPPDAAPPRPGTGAPPGGGGGGRGSRASPEERPEAEARVDAPPDGSTSQGSTNRLVAYVKRKRASA